MGIIWLALLIIALIGGLITWRKQPRAAVQRTGCKRFNGLQWRMTFSYVWITIASVLTVAILLNIISFILIPIALLIGLLLWLRNRRKWRAYVRGLRWRSASTYFWIAIISLLVIPALFNSISNSFSQAASLEQSPSRSDMITTVNLAAQQYANAIAQQAPGQTLGAAFPYPLGQPLSTNPDTYQDTDASSFLKTEEVPYLPELYSARQPVTFALLIAPDQRILSSSYPARYPINALATVLLPAQSQWIAQTLRGHALQGTFVDTYGTMIYATASISDKHTHTIGAIYIQVPLTTLQNSNSNLFTVFLWNPLAVSLVIVLVLLILLPPLGGIFGFISTRSLVRRLKKLANATTLVANGDYQQRLSVASQDEIGQLEQQFNRMTEQLGESVSRQKELAEENARLAERARISRELHDAISQDLFSLNLLAGGLQSALPADSPLQHQAGVLEQTTNNTIREMRALLLELRPTRLERINLVEALEELATAYSTRLGIQVHTCLASIQLGASRELTLLRVAQEALANAARHANATDITITLALQGRMVCLCLRDNGRGFQANTESLRHGLGLRMMEERVGELHGILKLESTPEQGTSLEIQLPLEEEL